MKALRIMVILMAAALLVFGLSGAAFAFHNGGVGFCEGCHTMHNSITSGTVAFIANGTTGANGQSSTSGVGGWTGAVGTPLNNNQTANGGTSGVGVGEGENQYLLRGSDPSSTCLNCHAATTSTPAYYQEMSKSGASFIQHEAGDFQWMLTSYTYTLVNPDMSTSTATSEGWNHGHQVVAQDFGLDANPTLTAAPGSTVVSNTTGYPAGNLACNSCHDPHGQSTIKGNGAIKGSGSYGTTGAGYGSYRLLANKDYDPGGGLGSVVTGYDPTGADGNTYTGFPLQTGTTGTPSGFSYMYNAPVAVAYNGTGGDWNVDYSGTSKHNAYGTGMSEFCANCHNQFLNTDNTVGSSTSSHRHPAGTNPGMMDAVYGNYNDYTGTGAYASASANYWALVPFEEGQTPSAGDTTANLAADSTNSEVMCLTCHRAHASAFDHDTRWDTYVTFMTDSSVLRSGLTTAQQDSAYYGSKIANGAGAGGVYQRQLCNKCHVQD